jgi:hypothetical protein
VGFKERRGTGQGAPCPDAAQRILSFASGDITGQRTSLSRFRCLVHVDSGFHWFVATYEMVTGSSNLNGTFVSERMKTRLPQPADRRMSGTGERLPHREDHLVFALLLT